MLHKKLNKIFFSADKYQFHGGMINKKAWEQTNFFEATVYFSSNGHFIEIDIEDKEKNKRMLEMD